ncbi:MAG: 30S ribosomal protein S16, partial [Gammaproteobacteria bacterium]|nr:30S ribosomal protein S16 [Gammaproteobacteria bacterium]
MVRIRLSRGGSKKRPFFHVVATNSRSSRDGKYIERIGFYNPRASDNEDDIRIDIERINYWESVGAQLSDKVRHLLKLLELTREERANKKNEKINKKKLIRQEKKEAAEEAPAEEPEAETKDEPEAAEEAPA